jgi:hypothetical protein
MIETTAACCSPTVIKFKSYFLKCFALPHGGFVVQSQLKIRVPLFCKTTFLDVNYDDTFREWGFAVRP